MRHITEEDLILLFYGEHTDPALATSVADSKELSARFDALCAELKLADAYQPPPRGDNYGAAIWQRISPQLTTVQSRTGSRWKTWLSSISQPRFSLAGALSLAVVVALAFLLGRNGGQNSVIDPLNQLLSPTIAMADIDAERLLTHSVSGHLEQVNLVLTQFANGPASTASEAEYATDMLVANRLYRQAATTQGKHQLAAFLATLEPLLIEMAYAAQAGSPATRERMQQEVRNGLLFRVRVMNKQLKKPEIST